MKMQVTLAAITLFMVCHWDGAVAQGDPIVKVEQGKLRGRVAISGLGEPYFSFQGIPYAKPPLGSLRFKDAEEPDIWNGTRDASHEGCVCPHLDPDGDQLLGCEDCLVLNVYSPKLPEDGSERLPVMFFIHGGGFLWGSGNTDLYGPEYLIAEGVILVTINYRLSCLGFLFLQEAAPGNAGLKDQVAAMRWVKRNIAAFNGDPNKVTIFGESAGGVSAHWHMLSPMSKGLFRAAISQSGSVLCPWAVQDDAYETSVRLAQIMGCAGGDNSAMTNCMRGVPYERLIREQMRAASSENRARLMVFAFVPVMEEMRVSGVETFVTGSPNQLIMSGAHHKVPYMTGITNAEWIVLLDENITYFDTEENLRTLGANWTAYVLPETRLRDGTKHADEAMQDLQNFFLDGNELTFDNLPRYQDMFTDLEFGESMYYNIKYMAQSNTNDIYVYSFTESGDLNYLKRKLNVDLPGASHEDDLGYLFKMDILPDVSPDNPSYITRQRTVRMWTNFAKCGNPTPHDDPLLGKKWKPYTSEERNYLEIGDGLKTFKDLYKKRVQFWEDFYKKYGV